MKSLFLYSEITDEITIPVPTKSPTKDHPDEKATPLLRLVSLTVSAVSKERRFDPLHQSTNFIAVFR